jgi:cyclopropane-fatty-acyl-phospholipid synthase
VIWGPTAPTSDHSVVEAPKGSNEYLVGVLRKFYPGSWLPQSLDQIREAAKAYFRVLSLNNGRLDYIQTLSEWDRRIYRFSFPKLLEALKLAMRYVSSRDFRYKMESMLSGGGYMRECLVRQVMDHQRIVLEKLT